MTNDDTKTNTVPETQEAELAQAEQDAKTIDMEQDEAAELEDEDPAFDPAMFAQVEEMMGKLGRVDAAEAELSELKGKYARLLADFENYRRRTTQDVLDAESAGISKAAEQLMPVYDDLGRAAEMGSGDPTKILPGVQAVQATVLRVFEKLGLQPTGDVGEAFDPAWHEALQVVPGAQDDVIVQVYQVGFRMGDKLVRPARVVVSRASN